MPSYRGRLAPSPTGYLHLGHARTFLIAEQRAIEAGGTLILRNEDLDPDRCRAEYVSVAYDDLKWIGLQWAEGPDCGGSYGPYSQSERRRLYLEQWENLRDRGAIYPCTCSRKELALAATAPNDADNEPLYPGNCRLREDATSFRAPAGVNWRFRVPEGQEITFLDQRLGAQSFVAGSDFGDFVIWRRDDVPAYQLAVVADDHAMEISEVVRGADLLKSTARQLLLYCALGFPAPHFYHCDLLRDDAGTRLAKRHDALSIRHLRECGWTPAQVRERALRG
ncbi:MAG TPA: tRNA glutamyl-Q(34) synthetase GluQRS [Terriglobales bacterium]|nr:tRNA glutamyl-Q(34) synthetase GluQRS [Terriglobales bacterium]